MGWIAQTLLAFLLTVVLGGWIARVWQARTTKETRFFEASKEIYAQMVAAADELSDLVGRRIYCSQRVCLTDPASPGFPKAVEDFRATVLEWNNKLLRMELSIRTRFRDSYLSSFECLQSDLTNVTLDVDHLIERDHRARKDDILRELKLVRWRYFEFVQGMVKEARLLHRQMHFGIVVRYNQEELPKMSTYDLIKALFTTRVEGQAVVRSPSDFGLPVSVWDARLGIHE